MNGEARPAAGAAVFGACRTELAVTVCATGRKGGGGGNLKTRISDYRKGKEEEKKERKCLERRDEIYRYRSLRNGVLRVQ